MRAEMDSIAEYEKTFSLPREDWKLEHWKAVAEGSSKAADQLFAIAKGQGSIPVEYREIIDGLFEMVDDLSKRLALQENQATRYREWLEKMANLLIEARKKRGGRPKKPAPQPANSLAMLAGLIPKKRPVGRPSKFTIEDKSFLVGVIDLYKIKFNLKTDMEAVEKFSENVPAHERRTTISRAYKRLNSFRKEFQKISE